MLEETGAAADSNVAVEAMLDSFEASVTDASHYSSIIGEVQE